MNRPTYGEILKMRKERKRAFDLRGSLQAKFHKAQMIITPKGKNGRSMSPELLAKHGITAPRKEEA